MHDNTRPHTVRVTGAGDCGQPGVRGVTTSIIPSDYRLFGPMTTMLGGQKFASDMEVQWAVCQWLAQQPTLFFCIEHSQTCSKMGQIFKYAWRIC